MFTKADEARYFELQRKIADQLGEPVRTFPPNRTGIAANRIAGYIICLLMFVGGLALAYGIGIRDFVRHGVNLPIYHEKEPSWIMSIVGILLGVTMSAAGIWFATLVKVIFQEAGTFMLVLCPRGFYYQTAGELDAYPWERIDHVDVVSAGTLPGNKDEDWYRVTRVDGCFVDLAPSATLDFAAFFELLKDECKQRGISWIPSQRY